MKEKKQQKIFFTISAMILFMAFCGLVWFINAKIDCLISSDDSSELVLGHLLASENRLLSRNWYYSTELRVVNTQVFYALFFKIFSNWHIVRVVSYACMYIVLIAVYYFLCRVLECKEYFIITAALLVIPFSEQYFEFVLKGAYYIPHISITFLTLGLIECFVLSEIKKKSIIYLSLSFVLSVFVGMGGARQLVILYIPLFLAAVFIVLSNLKDTGEKIECQLNFDDKKYILFSGIAFIGAGIGYIINSKVLIRIYHFQVWDNISFTGFDISKLVQVINGFLYSYGYTSGNVFGKALISNFVCMCWLLLTCISCVYLIKNRKKVKASNYRLALFTIAAFITYILLYMFTDLAYADRYNLPIIILSVPVIAVFIKNIGHQMTISYLLIITFVVAVALNGFMYCRMKYKVDNTAELRNISTILQEQQYTEGYTTFWRANVLTELSNGTIDVRCWADDIDDHIDVTDIDATFKWLQLISHDYTHPEGKVFLLFTAGEWENNTWKGNLSTDNILYQSENYIVIGYENYEKLLNDTAGYTYSFEGNRWMTNGEDKDGHRELYQEGISYGPYKTMPDGHYIVHIEGNNLLNADIRCTYNNGQDIVPIEFIKKSDDVVEYTFDLDSKKENVEFVVENKTSELIILNNLKVERGQ